MGIGLHFGPAVMGDIGTERNMAFAVIGDTINTGSRLEALTRELSCEIVASDTLIAGVRGELNEGADALLKGFTAREPQKLRGRSGKVSVWTYSSC